MADQKQAEQKLQQLDDSELERLTRPQQNQKEQVEPVRSQKQQVEPARPQKPQPKQEPETEIERLARAQKERKKVSGCFLIGEERHYRLRRLYEKGDVIRIENEVPSPTWTPFDPAAPAKVELPPVAPKVGDPANTAI